MPETNQQQNTKLHKFDVNTGITSNLQLNNIYPYSKGQGMLIAEIDTGIDPMYNAHVFRNIHETYDGRDDDNNG